MISEGQVLGGRYRLISLQGEGGMASVYKAYDLTLERTVAIKVLRPEYDAGDAFRREAQAIAKLPHPNVVTVYDVGHDGDTQYIVMEYVEGQDLQDHIAAEAPFRVGRALDIVVQVCAAVGFAHEKGVLHCDLKPQNVLVLPDGQVKVADFGIARALSSASAEQRDKVWGTPYYASPELIAGKTLTPASDVYAIGVMLYEMLAGRPPFEGQSAVDVARQHLLSAPPPIRNHNPHVSHYVEQALDRALAKDPAKRYPTVKQFGKLLAAYRQRGEAVTQPLQPLATTEVSAAERTSTTPPMVSTPAVPLRQLRQGFDWLLLFLGAFAFVAVIGLFPLWGTVIDRALDRAVPMPTATAVPEATPTRTTAPQAVTHVPTPTIVYVYVPDLVGRELEEARQLAHEKGLRLAISEQRHDADIPASHVIAQGIVAGQQMPQDTEIGVVVSLGPEMVTMPNVIGFPALVKQLDLEDLGLVVTITETWSVEPAGLIITQTPPADTEISAGSVVTLTVSSGPRGKVRANLDNKVLLHSCEFNAVTFRPGDTVQILITWHVLHRLSGSYMTFIHVTDPSGRIITQLDRLPLGGSRPTDTWRAGEKLLDPYTLTLPSNIPPGSYWVRVGLYRGDHRLPVVDPGQAQAEDDAVLVQQIAVKGT